MRHYWLTYRDACRLTGVVIIDAPSLIQARLKAPVRGIDAGASFGEGHQLDADLIELVPPAQIGRMLPGAEAKKLLARFERKPKRRT